MVFFRLSDFLTSFHNNRSQFIIRIRFFTLINFNFFFLIFRYKFRFFKILLYLLLLWFFRGGNRGGRGCYNSNLIYLSKFRNRLRFIHSFIFLHIFFIFLFAFTQFFIHKILVSYTGLFQLLITSFHPSRIPTIYHYIIPSSPLIIIIIIFI